MSVRLELGLDLGGRDAAVSREGLKSGGDAAAKAALRLLTQRAFVRAASALRSALALEASLRFQASIWLSMLAALRERDIQGAVIK